MPELGADMLCGGQEVPFEEAGPTGDAADPAAAGPEGNGPQGNGPQGNGPDDGGIPGSRPARPLVSCSAEPDADDLSAAAAPQTPAGDPDGVVATPVLADIAAGVSRLAASAAQYHDRARQREGVIEYLRAELDLLRRGERRSLMRPILTALSRLHADLLVQSRTLPADFDADKASKLLESFADTVEGVLADAGISTHTPEAGEPFDPRRHRKIKGEPTTDSALDGLVAAVRKAGYLDLEADSLLSPAEVILYQAIRDEQ
jgi:molecular chaperone GrpE (heat shock protein)